MIDIRDRPMRSRTTAVAPMGGRGRALLPGSRAGRAGPAAAAAAERRLGRSRCARLLARLSAAPVAAHSLRPRSLARCSREPRARSSRRSAAQRSSRAPGAPGSGGGGRATHAPGRWALGPRGRRRRRRDHGPETRGARRARRRVLLRQPAGEIPALLLQHAFLGEFLGEHLGTPRCTARPQIPPGSPLAKEEAPRGARLQSLLSFPR